MAQLSRSPSLLSEQTMEEVGSLQLQESCLPGALPPLTLQSASAPESSTEPGTWQTQCSLN